MSSARPKKKSGQKVKNSKGKAAIQPAVRAVAVRTELSPYNRDYVEALPATVLNVRTTHRESIPLKRVVAAAAAPKLQVASKLAPVIAQQRRPISQTPRKSRSLSLKHLLIGTAITFALALIGAGTLLISQSNSVSTGAMRVASAEFIGNFLGNTGDWLSEKGSNLKLSKSSDRKISSAAANKSAERSRPAAKNSAAIFKTQSHQKLALASQKGTSSKKSKSTTRSR